MARTALKDKYLDQRQEAAQRLLSITGDVGGWGLTPTSVSSIVNTAEGLHVVAAAGLFEDERVAKSVRFLVEGIPAFYAPQSSVGSSGRGLHTRYLTFGLEGLTADARVIQSPGGRDAVRFCLQQLRAQVDANSGGVYDFPGKPHASFHQTARALISTSKLLSLADHRLPSLDIDMAQDIADSASSFLLSKQEPAGAWAVSPLDVGVHHPAITAIATTALGQYRRVNDSNLLRLSQRRAAEWLMLEAPRWQRKMSSERSEKSTVWEYLDYAEVPRAIAGTMSGSWERLKQTWIYLLNRWVDQDVEGDVFLWAEPKSGKGSVTVRAAYHTVMALETALGDSRLLLPKQVDPVSSGSIISSRRVDTAVFVLETTEGELVLEFGAKTTQAKLFQALTEERTGLDKEQLARALGIKPQSVSTYFGRTIQSVNVETSGVLAEFAESGPLEDGREGYRVRWASG